MDRRAFLAGLTATAAGLLIPERKVWALDRTMIAPHSTVAHVLAETSPDLGYVTGGVQSGDRLVLEVMYGDNLWSPYRPGDEVRYVIYHAPSGRILAQHMVD